MDTIKNECNTIVGYSDHTAGISVPVMAVNMGAVMIEKHLTLDKNLPGPDHKASIEPPELEEMVQDIRNKKQVFVKEALGSGIKIPSEKEKNIARIARKSIVAGRDILNGTILSEEMLKIKRPGTGLFPRYISSIIGRKTKRELKKDELISFNDIDVRRIIYITGTRADYGIVRQVLLELKKNPVFDISIIATGMHLMKQFGYSIDEVKNDGFEILRSEEIFGNDNFESMTKFFANSIKNFTEIIKREKPDFIMVNGDRAEALAGALAGLYLRIPVIHLHGGEKTETIDDSARHAITKLSHLHFVASDEYAKRVKMLGGEEEFRIFNVGARLDAIRKNEFTEREEVHEKFGLKKTKEILIVIQHPVSEDIENSGIQMKETVMQ